MCPSAFLAASLNPYFIGLSILIALYINVLIFNFSGLNPYFIGLSILITVNSESIENIPVVSILILLDYLFLLASKEFKA